MLRLVTRPSFVRVAGASRNLSSSAPLRAPSKRTEKTSASKAPPLAAATTEAEATQQSFEAASASASSSSSHLTPPPVAATVSLNTEFSITSGLPIVTLDEPPASQLKKEADSTGDSPNATIEHRSVFLLRTSWLSSNEQIEVLKEIEAGRGANSEEAEWILKEYEVAYSFRQARSRLWMPAEVAQKAGERGETSLIDEAELDSSLKQTWIEMTRAKRREALARARFECIRRLGWRKGYSSGYPLNVQQKKDKTARESRERMLNDLGSDQQSKAKAALETLAGAEEKSAWQAWKNMNNATRAEEERLMWATRDRSMIYIDDTDTSTIFGVHSPRWYRQPQKIGDLSYLPNILVRLVRNNTVRNGNYDAFKATFRVPLSMHKHGLRSYLLAIYGLRTTWCRSSIHRAAITRSRLGGKKQVGHSSKTFKKVEVGLLEPFVFPEISPRFRREQLFEDEIKAMIGKNYMHMGGTRRWRTKKRPNPLALDSSNASVDNDTILVQGDDGIITATRSKEDLQKEQHRGMMVWGGGTSTMRRSRILELIHQKRQARESAIADKMQQLQR